jgi:hypothetical protein
MSAASGRRSGNIFMGGGDLVGVGFSREREFRKGPFTPESRVGFQTRKGNGLQRNEGMLEEGRIDRPRTMPKINPLARPKCSGIPYPVAASCHSIFGRLHLKAFKDLPRLGVVRTKL